MGSGLQGEPVEGRGDHEPGQLLGGGAGVVGVQQPAGGEDAERLRSLAPASISSAAASRTCSRSVVAVWS